MELWIRSQDKEDLLKVENIRCWNETQIAVNVKTSFNNVDYVVVGEYETKERALEVLDEIQNLIKPIMLFQNCECDNDTLKAIKKIGACVVNNDARIEQINQTVFYEMPKE